MARSMNKAAAAAALILCIALLPDVAHAASCSYLCTPIFSSSTSETCLSDCLSCASTVQGGNCRAYFNPYFGAFGSGYSGYSCGKSCPLEWWEWLLVILGCLLFAALVGGACFYMRKRQRENAAAHTMMLGTQMAQQEQPYPPQGYYPQGAAGYPPYPPQEGDAGYPPYPPPPPQDGSAAGYPPYPPQAGAAGGYPPYPPPSVATGYPVEGAAAGGGGKEAGSSAGAH